MMEKMKMTTTTTEDKLDRIIEQQEKLLEQQEEIIERLFEINVGKFDPIEPNYDFD